MATKQNTARENGVTDLRPVFKLLQNPKMAEFYAALQEEPSTVPDLLPKISSGKTAAYDYCELLEKAGLVSETGTKNNTTVYETRDFDITIHIEGDKLTVTPELARVLAERNANSEIDRFVDRYGVETLAEFLPLARKYSTGEMTHRAIAEILGISRAAAFEMLGEVLEILDIAPDSKHLHPSDLDDGEATAIVEEARPDE